MKCEGVEDEEGPRTSPSKGHREAINNPHHDLLDLVARR